MGCKHSSTAPTLGSVTAASLGGGGKPGLDLPEVKPSSGKFHENNFVSDKLGKGAYASVYAVSKVAGEEPRFAAKVVNLRLNNGRSSKTKEQMVARELKILQKVSATGSEYVVKFLESFTEGHYVYMVMEKCDDTLISVLKNLEEVNEDTYRPLVQGMLQGLSVVHNVGVVHRDVKPDNYMVSGSGDDRIVKLCDFGLAKAVTSPYKNELVGINGTAPFMAPEMVKGLPYGAKVDTWSLGVILYLMLFGHFPYMPAVWTSDEMKFTIRVGNPAPSFTPRVPGRTAGEFQDIVSFAATNLAFKLLNRSARDRPTADEALQQAFFQKRQRNSAPQPSLRPMLESAEHFGAFGQTGPVKEQEEPSAMDVSIAVAQVQHGQASAWARQTSAGSTYSCGAEHVPITAMDSDMDINGDIS
mmetsp:Transcript_125391/g.360246  ORF Transcript_125391/g.360246 Transcript_125391/m.360246 type:complete len:414 (-) Transcript_125391:175-1416(-)